ncbi:hypothetical protein [Roseiconus lacunae]|uniref:Tetratricopeptide repeat protein n=1 Tax=Roseiconus lacunae TaxID=2605694 RepID=A0ABT7PMF1_9BACT|nr:hypothetical protein [Roseiconus lacunae]MDM4017685.1 hypothetical protein [Roseiconus lacunae]
MSRFNAARRPDHSASVAIQPALRRLAVSLMTLAAFTPCIAGAAEPPKPQSNDQKIAELIEKLGSDSYATRVRARDQLKEYGLEAFDALYEAQYHNDSEVQTAARYLQQSLLVTWSQESDPKEVREILYEYGAQDSTDRLARIELLGRLPDRMGIEALARLARFDRLELLSRRAAMLVLKQAIPDQPVRRQILASQLESVIGDNSRDAITWLRAYIEDLRQGRYDPQRWEEVVATQRRKVDLGLNQDITAKSVLQLIKVIATRAILEDARDSAMQISIENLDLIAPSTIELAGQADWAITHGLYPVVIELYQRQRHAFSSNAELLYSAAQAYRDNGETDKGEQLATEAFQISPLPDVKLESLSEDALPREDQDHSLTDHQLEDIAFLHYAVANRLRMRGQYDWAEREHRSIIASCGVETNAGIRSRISLSSIFAEQLRHDDASDVLGVLVHRIERDAEYAKRLIRFDIGSHFVQSEYNFQQALELLAGDPIASEIEEAKQLLQLAYRQYSGNIDILIQMYRVKTPEDTEWTENVKRQLSQHIGSLHQTITQYESSKRAMPDERFKAVLGDKYNEYAWLVSNTEGDFDRALQCSLRSLKFASEEEIEKRAARLDTCARCYFATGQIDRAIETQKEALDLEQHSLAMQRQLAEFQAAKASES